MKFILSNYIKPVLIRTNQNICNASVLMKNNKLKLIGRNTNYSFININNNSVGWPFRANYYTNNILYDLNLNTGKTVFNKYLSSVSNTDMQNYDIFGDEDIRVISWNNTTYLSYTKIHAKVADFAANRHDATIHIAELTDDLNVVNEMPIKTDRNVEKNWAPIEGMPFTYMYDVNTFTTINTTGAKTRHQTQRLSDTYRGSTPFIKLGDNYIGIIHERINNDFYHRFILLTKDLTLLRYFR